MAGALSHIKVLDLSRILAGPWASQLLADLGADVIKIEKPRSGDDTRTWGPPWIETPHGQDTSTSTYFTCANRNKRSIAIDIALPQGQALIKRLAQVSDVFIENFKVGGLAQYGLDYPSLKALNPKLIYCSITGFGQTGPYAHRAGYDFLIQGLGGLMSVTGRPDDEAGGGPMKVGVALTDVLTGLYASNAIQAALLHRDVSGMGQHIDMSLLDVQVAALANQASAYLNTGNNPNRLGNAHPSIVPYQDFPTKDGYMILAIGNDGQFERFCMAAGCPELASDDRFRTNKARVVNRGILIPLMNQKTVTQTTAQWIALLETKAVPCGPINTLDGVFADEQVQARQLQIDMINQLGAQVSMVASPLRLSETPVSYRLPPPELGEHTHQVLEEVLGLSESELIDLQKKGIIS